MMDWDIRCQTIVYMPAWSSFIRASYLSLSWAAFVT
jgi:hypothetical protein